MSSAAQARRPRSHDELSEYHKAIVWTLASMRGAVHVDLLADSLEDIGHRVESSAAAAVDVFKRALADLSALDLIHLSPECPDNSTAFSRMERPKHRIAPLLVEVTQTGRALAEALRNS